ncbi:proton-conducting transporter membrane subunit [Caulobacter sp. FWC2]|uniref:proton-conducting transporter transmembrane domain-containing protein n=1 Tax=Caulobacter sp. FWC2 TaxID=69664 RepID=UPI000C162646|nr:proton-conducting transporter membrane subunit [Caulobacter sp. FWC2]PIB92848.1 oxidoreductase [Caulobacter sp. FWC2]
MGLEPWLGATAAIAVTVTGGLWAVLTRQSDSKTEQRCAEWIAAVSAIMVVGAGLSALAWPASPRTGLWLRIDLVATAVGLLVTIVGWASLRFARVQLRGEPGARAFSGWLLLALAGGLLSAFSDHIVLTLLGWVLASLSLHAPIRFRATRAASRLAAQRKFWIDRIAEGLLATAIVILLAKVGDGRFGAIGSQAANLGPWTPWVAGLVAGAVILRSAQLPFQGWLLELLEAPTPVSAILHAGLISAGGLLLMRLSSVMGEAPLVMAALALVGGASALLAGLVQTAQPAAKTALVWSTIAQMGFMLLECGLGLYPLALLHILAHGLYKAKAFLWASNAVDLVSTQRRLGPVAAPGPRAILGALAIAMAAYGLADALMGAAERPLQAHVMGMILVLGVGYLLAQGLADAAPAGLTLRLVSVSLATFVAYFALQTLAWRLTVDAFARPPAPGPLQIAILALSIITFAALVVFQAALPRWRNHPWISRLRVHFASGLYLDLIFNRLARRALAKEA